MFILVFLIYEFLTLQAVEDNKSEKLYNDK
jgi:hypothetical protein